MMIFDANLLLESYGPNFGSEPDVTARAVYHLKELLKTAGWIHQASGDGLAAFSATPGNVNDVITQEGNGVAGMANPLAWFVLQHPASSRQFCFQKGNVNFGEWRVKYSFDDGFTGGTPSATETPLSTDQIDFLGSGPDASPNFTQWFGPTYNPGLGGSYCQIGADNAAPYGWFMAVYPISGSDGYPPPQCGGLFDPLVDTVSGDLEPYAFYFSTDAGTAWTTNPTQYGFAYALHDRGGPTQSWGAVKMGTYESVAVPFCITDNSVWRLPVFYLGDANTGAQFKGRSTMLHSIGQTLINGQTLQVVTPRDEMSVGWFSFPWNGALTKV